MTPWLWLYRPTVPSARAQAVQVVHMAHAMAATGRPVTLFVEPAHDAVTADTVLDWYGLTPLSTLRLHVLRGGRTAASLAFRAHVHAWVARHGSRGVVYARSKRYAHWLPTKARLVLEVHEVESLQLVESGRDSSDMRRLEAAVIGRAVGVVANAPGTLELLSAVHRLPLSLVSHNATHVDRVVEADSGASGAAYIGSVHALKDLPTLARAAALAEIPVTVVGPGDASELEQIGQGWLRATGPVPYRSVPRVMSSYRALVVPLSDGLFGRRLTSPLKVWDARAAGIPLVGADLPALHSAIPGAFLPYRPGDAPSLAWALRQAVDDPPTRRWLGRALVRTWGQRAAEIAVFVEAL